MEDGADKLSSSALGCEYKNMNMGLYSLIPLKWTRKCGRLIKVCFNMEISVKKQHMKEMDL